MSPSIKNNYAMIKIDNVLFDRLDIMQFYIYCWLRYRYVAYSLNYTTTSIDVIANEVMLVKDNTRNKQRIKGIILKLEQDGIISIAYNGKFKNSTALRISFDNINPSQYTALDYKYAHVDDCLELYVIATITRWKYAKDKLIPLSEWEQILKVSKPTVLSIFDRMEEKGLLYVKSGEHKYNDKGEIRQEINQYYLVCKEEDGSIVEDKEDDVLPVRTKLENKTDKNSGNINPFDNYDYYYNRIKDRRIDVNDNLISSGNVRLEDIDFYIYATTTCPILKMFADYKFGIISKSVKGKKFIDDMKRKAYMEVERKKRVEENNKIMRNMPPPDLPDWQ